MNVVGISAKDILVGLFFAGAVALKLAGFNGEASFAIQACCIYAVGDRVISLIRSGK